jgi:hypothetical protein
MQWEPFEVARPNNTYKFSSYLKENTTVITTNISLLMLRREIITVYYEDHTKSMNAELLNVKAGRTYSHHCAL